MKTIHSVLCFLGGVVVTLAFLGSCGGGSGSSAKTAVADAGMLARIVALEARPIVTQEEHAILARMHLVEEPMGSFFLCSEDGPNDPCTRQTVAMAPTIRFEGVNVQVVNGTGLTEEPNGLGNLIIGYQEPRCCYEGNACWDSESNERGGSHNLVVGSRNNYKGTATLVAGDFNGTWEDRAVCVGGSFNLAFQEATAVVGGQHNHAFGELAAVLGGRQNSACEDFQAVAGGVATNAGICECGGGE